jgi:glycosyltransferase involved in cell wall biosynthesis
MEKKILVFADADSRLKWAYNTALTATPAENIHIVVVGKMPSDEQLEVFGASKFDWFDNFDAFKATIDVTAFTRVVCAATGSLLNRLIVHIHSVPDRPIIICGYEGLVYEKHIEGLLWRYGADIILVNSPSDYTLFSNTLKELGLDGSCLHCAGFARLAGNGEQVNYQDNNKIVFATQPSVPRSYQERVYLLNSLIAFAKQHPELEVIIKGRVRPGEGLGTPYHETYPYESIGSDIAKTTPPPRNIVFSYEGMDTVLRQSRALVSLSSTALLEAMAVGVPAVALNNLGVREAYGNHFFLGAGIFSSIDKLLAVDKVNMSESKWCRDAGLLLDRPIDLNLVKKNNCAAFYSFEGKPYSDYMKSFSKVSSPYGIKRRVFSLLRRLARKWLL